MGFGGFHPFPKRFGGSTRRLQRIVESLNSQRGTAYDTTQSSYVYAENMAAGRAIDNAWSTNQRLGNQWQSARMTTLLPRWEKILQVYPLTSDTDTDRRVRVATKRARVGTMPTQGAMISELEAAVGDVFEAVEYIDVDDANIHVPDGTYPFGTVAAGSPWSSTVAHILIRTSKPAAYTEGQYYEAVAPIHPIMDAIAPAWVTFDWYRLEVGGLAGFYLDHPVAAGDTPNLDNMVFD